MMQTSKKAIALEENVLSTHISFERKGERVYVDNSLIKDLPKTEIIPRRD